jgi:putative hydrolase of HD superfamily
MSQMKKVERWKGRYWDDYPIERKESVPDHIWRMLMLAMYLQGKLSIECNFEKLLKIIIVHDMAEIRTGDISASNADSTYNAPETKKLKEAAERKAMNDIFSSIDEAFWGQCISLWEEYEANQTNEAKVAKCIDKLEAFLQAFESSGAVLYPEHYEFCLKIIESQKWRLDDFDSALRVDKTRVYRSL